MSRLGIAAKVYLSLAIIIMAALAVGAMGISTLGSYKLVVDEMDEVSQSAVLGERLNGLILAVVMDSRGIYMSGDQTESEKYAVPLLKNLTKLQATLQDWRQHFPKTKQQRFSEAETATENFIKFRTELVRLSRESTLAEARSFGDNDANRKVRSALNEAVKALAAENENDVKRLRDLIASEYSSDLARLLTILVAGLAFGVGIAVFVIRSKIVSPLYQITQVMKDLASGNLNVTVPFADSKDEIGTMAGAVEVFKRAGLDNEALRRAQQQDREQAERNRATIFREMADEFEATVKSKVAAVVTSTSGIGLTSNSMAKHSEHSGGRSIDVGDAAQNTQKRAAIVSSATRQLSVSVGEIAKQIVQSTEIARKAVGDVNITSSHMTGLSDAVQSIGQIVKLISEIASQTNLLALNATIEAARAGDAGKGFAVVANEVKSLANQTARATDEITKHVGAVQQSTREMTDSINDVVQTIAAINDVSSTIAVTIRDQETATHEIAENIDQVALEAQGVLNGVTTLAKASTSTCAGTVRVIWSAKNLTKVVQSLDGEVGHFLAKVRGLQAGHG